MAEKPTCAEEEQAQRAHRLKKFKDFLVRPETLRNALKIVALVRVVSKFVQAVAEFLG